MFTFRGMQIVQSHLSLPLQKYMTAYLIGLLASCIIGLLIPLNVYADTGLVPRAIPEKPVRTELWPGLREDLIIVKFVEGSQVRLREGNLLSLANHDISAANGLLTNRDDFSLLRLFTRPELSLENERVSAQQRSGKQMADLNNYYQVRLLQPSRAAAEAFIDALNALTEVEIAYAEPIPEVAVWLGDPASSKARVSPPNSSKDTPDFRSYQTYLDAAPIGIDATSAWPYAGGRGQGVKIIDIELGWNWTHEDIPPPFFESGVDAYSDHGIAVTGIISAPDNGYGVTGIANEAEIGSHSVWNIPSADAFNIVVSTLDPGDIFVIELHCPGPQSGGYGQDGYIALEWWQANFDAIATGTANGIICCEAAGNGAKNFDDPIYEGRYDRNVRDSGAIIIGASENSELYPAGFSNFGSRVDLSGWGGSIATTGYGDLYGDEENNYYTAGFGGTSGATPIVTGAVAAIQGIYKAQNGGDVLPGGTIAQILKDTGTAMNSGGHIGPRPNLLQAVGALLGGVSTITGSVTALDTGLPLYGSEVQLLETGARTVTDINGDYHLTVTPGEWTIKTSRFGYNNDLTQVITTAGNSTDHSVVLAELEHQSLSGIVVDEDGSPLAGALVYLADVPIDPVNSRFDGAFRIDNIPVPFEGVVIAALDGRAPDMSEVILPDENLEVSLRLAISESFEAGPEGFFGSGEWELGTPTYPAGLTAHSGTQCWATNLSGDYVYGDQHLYSSAFVLPETGNPRLAFWHWHSIWGPFDGINVTMAVGGSNIYNPIEPIGGYTDPCIFRLNELPCEPGWTGSSGDWIPVVFDLSAFAGQSVRFSLNVGFYYGGTPGWYIDDLAVHAGPDLTSVSSATNIQNYLRVPWPTPSSGSITIGCSIGQPGPISVDVYDLAGHKIRSLASGSLSAGAHQFHWNGKDQLGQPASQGVYFVRLWVGGQSGQHDQILTKRVTLVR